MKNLVIIICLILAGFSVQGQLALQEGMVTQANQLYNTGDYAEAISQYEAVIATGYESAGLYFNLGNAYFKLNQITSSILFYEKARKLDPTDEDIRFNLALANSRIIDKMEPVPELFLKSWWSAVRDVFSSNLWAKFGLAFLSLGLITLFAFIISSSVITRKITFWSAVIFFIIMAMSFLFSLTSYREYSRQTTAIIFTPTVTVKSSPTENSVDLFVVHEGTKIDITDTVEGWSEVKLANGNVGWLKSGVYRLI
jgi:tetratricopeptide (TPR) repeat protein